MAVLAARSVVAARSGRGWATPDWVESTAGLVAPTAGTAAAAPNREASTALGPFHWPASAPSQRVRAADCLAADTWNRAEIRLPAVPLAVVVGCGTVGSGIFVRRSTVGPGGIAREPRGEGRAGNLPTDSRPMGSKAAARAGESQAVAGTISTDPGRKTPRCDSADRTDRPVGYPAPRPRGPLARRPRPSGRPPRRIARARFARAQIAGALSWVPSRGSPSPDTRVRAAGARSRRAECCQCYRPDMPVPPQTGFKAGVSGRRRILAGSGASP